MERVAADETSNQTPVGEQTLDHHLRAKAYAHLSVSGANHFPLQLTQIPSSRDLNGTTEVLSSARRDVLLVIGFHLV